jgi:hypothetical protein
MKHALVLKLRRNEFRRDCSYLMRTEKSRQCHICDQDTDHNILMKLTWFIHLGNKLHKLQAFCLTDGV